MYEELCIYHSETQNPDQKPYFEWNEEEERHYRQIFEYAKEDVVQQTHIIATTTNEIDQKVDRQNASILEKFKGIVLIIDETSRELETNVYIIMIKLTAWPKIVGVHMIGNVNQGFPGVIISIRASKPKVKNTKGIIQITDHRGSHKWDRPKNYQTEFWHI